MNGILVRRATLDYAEEIGLPPVPSCSHVTYLELAKKAQVDLGYGKLLEKISNEQERARTIARKNEQATDLWKKLAELNVYPFLPQSVREFKVAKIMEAYCRFRVWIHWVRDLSVSVFGVALVLAVVCLSAIGVTAIFTSIPNWAWVTLVSIVGVAGFSWALGVTSETMMPNYDFSPNPTCWVGRAILEAEDVPVEFLKLVLEIGSGYGATFFVEEHRTAGKAIEGVVLDRLLYVIDANEKKHYLAVWSADSAGNGNIE